MTPRRGGRASRVAGGRSASAPVREAARGPPRRPRGRSIPRIRSHRTGTRTRRSSQHPPAITMLMARVLPPTGGDTMFADQHAAFEQLSSGMQATLRSLRAVHRGTELAAAAGLELVEVERRHPVVIHHPETGREALFVNPDYTVGIDGWTADESRSAARVPVPVCDAGGDHLPPHLVTRRLRPLGQPQRPPPRRRQRAGHTHAPQGHHRVRPRQSGRRHRRRPRRDAPREFRLAMQMTSMPTKRHGSTQRRPSRTLVRHHLPARSPRAAIRARPRSRRGRGGHGDRAPEHVRDGERFPKPCRPREGDHVARRPQRRARRTRVWARAGTPPSTRRRGCTFDPPGTRIERLAEAVTLLRRAFAGERVDVSRRLLQGRGSRRAPATGGTASRSCSVVAASGC